MESTYGLLTSPKKQTDEFVLFAFLLFMANKLSLSIRILGESTIRQSAFRFFLTFRLLGALNWVRVHKGRSGHIFVKIPI